jgi:hypothetical protein
MKTIEYRNIIDKSSWPRGPWDVEPDKIQWPDAATGLPCLAVRIGRFGNWCGYVGVAPSHPLHGVDYSDLNFDVHGGLTFSDACRPGEEERGICHVPDEGEPADVWWFGFDCAHAFDLLPLQESFFGRIGMPSPLPGDKYRDLAYVKTQCAALAAQLRTAPE